MTFFLWTRALRTPSSWVVWSPLAALAYVYMVAAWGGYTFVLNMVGLHVTALVFLGRFTPSLHHAYTVFMLIGTYGAIQFPVVGLKPLKDMEHMGPLVMCLVLQVFYAASKTNTNPPPLSRVGGLDSSRICVVGANHQPFSRNSGFFHGSTRANP